MNLFSQCPWVSNKRRFKFFENLCRYLQLKAHHRYHWHWWQIFNQKNFNYFFSTPLCSRVNIYISLQVHFKVKLVWILFPLFATGVVDTGGILPLVSLTVLLTRVENLPLVLTTPAVVPVGKFNVGVVYTSGAPWLANISKNLKKVEMTLMLFLEAWGTMNYEKNLKQKYQDIFS
jgi:hypothetical protein